MKDFVGVEQQYEKIDVVEESLVEEYKKFFLLLYPYWNSAIPIDSREKQYCSSESWQLLLKRLLQGRRDRDRRKARMNKHCKFIWLHTQAVYLYIYSISKSMKSVEYCMKCWMLACATKTLSGQSHLQIDFYAWVKQHQEEREKGQLEEEEQQISQHNHCHPPMIPGNSIQVSHITSCLVNIRHVCLFLSVTYITWLAKH
jgi:hypothetical protein